jgi:hypothetical protein
VSPNVGWNGSLESYHPYLPPQKVSKFPKIECIHSRVPKNAKSHFGCLGPLGVNIISKKKNLLHFFWHFCIEAYFDNKMSETDSYLPLTILRIPILIGEVLHGI